jgi:hypothetical protein
LVQALITTVQNLAVAWIEQLRPGEWNVSRGAWDKFVIDAIRQQRLDDHRSRRNTLSADATHRRIIWDTPREWMSPKSLLDEDEAIDLNGATEDAKALGRESGSSPETIGQSTECSESLSADTGEMSAGPGAAVERLNASVESPNALTDALEVSIEAPKSLPALGNAFSVPLGELTAGPNASTAMPGASTEATIALTEATIALTEATNALPVVPSGSLEG